MKGFIPLWLSAIIIVPSMLLAKNVPVQKLPSYPNDFLCLALGKDLLGYDDGFGTYFPFVHKNYVRREINRTDESGGLQSSNVNIRYNALNNPSGIPDGTTVLTSSGQSFDSIQAALNSVEDCRKDMSNPEVTISVGNGLWREVVKVDHKCNVKILGQGHALLKGGFSLNLSKFILIEGFMIEADKEVGRNGVTLKGSPAGLSLDGAPESANRANFDITIRNNEICGEQHIQYNKRTKTHVRSSANHFGVLSFYSNQKIRVINNYIHDVGRSGISSYRYGLDHETKNNRIEFAGYHGLAIGRQQGNYVAENNYIYGTGSFKDFTTGGPFAGIIRNQSHNRYSPSYANGAASVGDEASLITNNIVKCNQHRDEAQRGRHIITSNRDIANIEQMFSNLSSAEYLSNVLTEDDDLCEGLGNPVPDGRKPHTPHKPRPPRS